MSLMKMENSGRYIIMKGTVFDLLNFSVIKIATSGSNWKFETNKKSGLIFSFFFFLAWLLLYSRNDFLLILFAGFGTNWRLIPAYYRKVVQVSKTRQILLFIHLSKWYELSTFSVSRTMLSAIDTEMKRWPLSSHPNK